MEGFAVVACYSGDTALAIAKQFEPDIAFLDLSMPNVSGIDLARQLRAQPWARGLRIAAITGMGQKADIERTAVAGFEAHFTKPVEVDTVLQFVASDQNANVVQFDADRRR